MNSLSLFLASVEFSDYLFHSGVTIAIVLISTLSAYLIGVPIGIILNVTDKNGLFKNKPINLILGVIINIFRSAPFIILLVFVLPGIRTILGTGVGNIPFTVALIIAAIPFVSRMVESALKELDYGIIEASLAMGASKLSIIFKVMLPEIKSSLIIGGTISFSTILGYSAMSGYIGGDGLGNLAIQIGYIRGQEEVTLISLIILILIVQLFQEGGYFIAKKLDHRKKGE